MKKFSILIILFIFQTSIAQNLYPNMFDSSNGISEGYGAWGEANYVREASIDVADKGVITFYHPDTAPIVTPTVFFISGWGQTFETYDKFFKYIASLGYPVVNIYNYSPGSINTSYQNSIDMMQQATSQYSDWIDTSKVGLMGHSYGGGSTIWIGKQVFDSNGLNWGENGRFIMMFAPWLSFKMEASDLESYPDNVKLLVLQSYDDFHNGGPNYNTDPRAVRAVYELINIPNSEKDYISIFSDEDSTHEYVHNANTYSYEANHYMSYTDLISGSNNPYDALDAYLSNRLTHAMIDYVFEGNPVGKNVALGNGSASQKDMGIMPDLAVTDYYVTNRPESVFEYKCSEDAPGSWGDPSIWKLQNYCNDSDNDGMIDYLGTKNLTESYFKLYPVPSSTLVNIRFVNGLEKIESIEIIDNLGRIVDRELHPNSYSIDIEKLIPGNYFIRIRTAKQSSTQKIIISE